MNSNLNSVSRKKGSSINNYSYYNNNNNNNNNNILIDNNNNNNNLKLERRSATTLLATRKNYLQQQATIISISIRSIYNRSYAYVHVVKKKKKNDVKRRRIQSTTILKTPTAIKPATTTSMNPRILLVSVSSLVLTLSRYLVSSTCTNTKPSTAFISSSFHRSTRATTATSSSSSSSSLSSSVSFRNKSSWNVLGTTTATFGISGAGTETGTRAGFGTRNSKRRSYSSSSQLFDSEQQEGGEFTNTNSNTNANETIATAATSSSTSKSTPTPPLNDTIAINTVGTALPLTLSVDQQLTDAKSKAASELILAIDPSTIEIVPFSDLAKEGEVFGGPIPREEAEATGTTTTATATAATNNGENENDPNFGASVTKVKANTLSSMFSETSHKPSLFNFVNMFRGSANYIANHRNTIVVYHIPGDLLSWDGFSDLMDDIALTWLLGIKPVIVVGCRRQIDERLLAMDGGGECSISSLSADGSHVECLEIQSSSSSNSSSKDGKNVGGNKNGKGKGSGSGSVVRYDSVRITDLDTLRIVKEEAGFVRFEVERQLGRALHLHGTVDHDALSDGNVVSGNFYSAQPYGVIDGVDFMYTGYPRRFEVDKIHQVLQSNDVVLLTPLGSSPSGEIFNVNTEHLAACVAGSLKAAKVIYFTNHGTAFREKNTNKLVQNLKLSDAKNVLEYNNIIINNSKGFATIQHDANLTPEVVEAFVKTGWSIAALEKGVKRAHIIAPINGALLQELYTRDGSGTLISRDIYEGIRNANVNDVAGIYELIEPLVSAGYLVNRPKNVLEKDIASYYVFTRDNLIIACAQLKLFENGYAEIGCMVVKKEYRSQGRGDAMLSFLERLSVMCDCPNVFVLSTQTMEWFVEHGYKAVEVDKLPPSRKKVYNYQRRSKIYMKHIKNIRDLDAAELWWNR